METEATPTALHIQTRLFKRLNTFPPDAATTWQQIPTLLQEFPLLPHSPHLVLNHHPLKKSQGCTFNRALTAVFLLSLEALILNFHNETVDHG